MVSWANFQKRADNNKNCENIVCCWFWDQECPEMLWFISCDGVEYFLRAFTPSKPLRHICCLVLGGSDIYSFQTYGNFLSLSLSASVLDGPSSLWFLLVITQALTQTRKKTSRLSLSTCLVSRCRLQVVGLIDFIPLATCRFVTITISGLTNPSLPRRGPCLWGLSPGCLQKQGKQI